jgi:hypothetical protein
MEWLIFILFLALAAGILALALYTKKKRREALERGSCTARNALFCPVA